MNLRCFLLALVLALPFSAAFSQKVKVKASLDSSEIVIGDQAKLSIEVRVSDGVVANRLTPLEDTIVGTLEVVSAEKADTSNSSGLTVIKQDFLITSFDSGVFVIPAIKYEADGQVFLSESLTLTVNNISDTIDVENGAVKDIKPNFVPSFNWSLFFKVLFIVLLSGVLLYLAYKYLYKRWKFKKNVDTEEAEPEVVDNRTIDQIAIDELNKIKKEELWKQEGREKLFYTQLTDVLREYLGKRFDVGTKEMTSYEILDALKYNMEASAIIDDLKLILTRSDMVKFAKQKPSADESEMSLVKSFFIVSQTVKKKEVEENVVAASTKVEGGDEK